MELITLESNEVLSERAIELGFRIEGGSYWPNKSYGYVVGLTFNKGEVPTTDSFFLHRCITASSAQDAHLKAAKEVYKQFAPIVTPRVPPKFNVKKYAALGYSNAEIMNLLEERNNSPAFDLLFDRREGRSNESFINLRVDLWDDQDIQIQYPNIWKATAYELYNPHPQFPIYLRLYNDPDRGMKSDSYKGKTFEECLAENDLWWEIKAVQLPLTI